MLTFDQKIAIADSFPELERKDVSLGRVNYHYEQSAIEKKTVLYRLHPNGNGYVYAGTLPEGSGYVADDKGYVNIRDVSEQELRTLIARAIRAMSAPAGAASPEPAGAEETWTNAKKQKLSLKFEEEDGMWYVFSGLNLDAAFETKEEAVEYLRDEGFSRF